MSVKNWNFFYKKEERTLKDTIVNAVSQWCAIGLLWFAFCDIVAEQYPFCLNVSASDGTAQTGMDWWLLILWMILLWGSYEWTSQKHKTWVTWMREGAILLPVAYGIWQYEKISKGFAAFVKIYVSQINNYYQLQLQADGGVQEWIPTAFTFLSMLLWLVCWLFAYGTKRKLWLLLFPLTALAMQLAVGFSPVGNGVLAVFAAGMLLFSIEGKSIVTKALAAGLTVFCLVVTPVLFEKQIQEYSTPEQKETVLAWQENLINYGLSDIFSMLDFRPDREKLRNEAPQYTGKEILEITADEMPTTNIYLRGYYGTEYRNHTWSCDESSFLAAAKAEGKTEREAAKEVFQMPYSIIELYNEKEVSYWDIGNPVTYQIAYTGVTGNVAYVPYYSDAESLDDSYKYSRDYLLKKATGKKLTEVNAFPLAQGQYLVYWYEIAGALERGLYGNSPYWSSLITDVVSLGEKKEALEWYNQQALNYLQVPKDMECLSEIAESKLRAKIEESIDLEIGLWLAGEMDMDLQTENLYRLAAMSAVEQYLTKNFQYSLILDDLPAGTDPVEYMLTESYEGYCMHFATAATLLLRELGVPARYVSGYVVNRSMYQIVGSEVQATVTDYAAHAWVEVYLDYIGWIPLETTPGYSDSGELPTTKDPQEMEKDAEEHRNQMNSQKQETERIPDSESESEQEPDQSEDTKPDESESQSQNGIGNGGAGGSGTGWISLLKNAGGIAGILMIILAIVCLIRSRIRHFDRILECEMQKEQTRKAVKRMNRRLFGMLSAGKQGVRIRVLRKGRFSDAEYEAALIARFTKVSPEEWKEYMRIVKKVHYSLETVSVEEMQYCYRCYQIVKMFLTP